MSVARRHFGMLSLAAVVAAFVVCMMCAMPSWATEEPVDGQDATVITVEWTDASGTHSVPVMESDVTVHSSTMGYIYVKNGITHVVGTNRWVDFDQVLEKAGASSFLTKDTKITLWAMNDGQSEPEEYTKYYPMYNKMSTKAYPLYFYKWSDRNEIVEAMPDEVYTCIALNCAAAEVEDGEIAADTLGRLEMSTARAPRLLWGLDSMSVSPDTGGNRFPSNLTKIVLTN